MRKIYIAVTEDFDDPVYKVGISKNPENRMKGIRKDYRRNCTLVYSVDAPEDMNVELAIHKELRPHRTKHMGSCAEWYEADYELIKECVDRAVRDFHSIGQHFLRHKVKI